MAKLKFNPPLPKLGEFVYYPNELVFLWMKHRWHNPQFIFYVHLHWMDKGDGVWATNSHLAKLSNCCVRSIITYIHEGLKLGVLIHVKWKRHNGRRVRVLKTKWGVCHNLGTTPTPEQMREEAQCFFKQRDTFFGKGKEEISNG